MKISLKKEKVQLLPDSKSIKKTSKIISVSEHLIKKARKLKDEKGILAKPEAKIGQPLEDIVKQKVIEIYESEEEDKVNRRWLSYSLEKNALFCTMCLAYSDITNESSFVNLGMTDWRHTLQRVKEHENSKTHENCVNCHTLRTKGKGIYNLMFTNEGSIHQKNIIERKQVLERITDVVKLIGKRGLAFRAHRSQSVSSLLFENNQEDHGHFLEIILLFSKYDAVLKLHLSRVIKEKKKNNETSAGTKGRGSFISLISKSTINQVILASGKLIQGSILLDIQEADRAANMRGQYNGFTSWLSKESPGQIHVWCYAHVLNLVVTDATSSVIEGTSLFQLLNSCAVFLRESY
ncbi:uncharacterized protein LOC136074398 [Hydra vulgaris]|uniref:Uncharacterized protein LOC136074398 n=1 Tax=Hydra vulgaris TaxID=6087 RepID=A0ABM4B1W5_HYDVU